MTERDISWWVPQVGATEYGLVREVLDSNYLNDGDVTSRFECEIARLVGARYAVGVTSGTAALFLALAALGVGAGDEVVVPDLTFIATANAVTLTGATPVLVDIDPLTLNMSPEAFRNAITARTRAVVPVHVSGRSADLSAIGAIARDHNVAIVEDAAEALTSSRNGRTLGTVGLAGCLSFSPNKTITTGQGGMVLTNDDALHLRLRELKDQGRPVRGTGGDDVHPSVGFNFKLTNLQAAVGLGQLQYLPGRLARQKRTYEQYARGLAGVSGVRLPGFDIGGGEVPQWVDAVAERRDELDRFLDVRGMHCRRFWFPLHTQAPYRRPDADFPGSVWATPRALWLPSAFTLSDDDVDEVVGAVREFAERHHPANVS
ncbi:MAG: DegT/DnrJ/EryC1/StrS family aminotransferase [SAR202 cluster bacterium]|jgi:perosamine synthetase|nr:aminotransferase DegT [Acidobacteriota bacterium]MDP6419923.1 DegT/DnrJ/EryC1/StrS family aminotransferase [SAR202 cluster bacterium]HAL46183.1 aminotransferase DegT [Dehalococcoidia bacterium]MDP6663009.1 DegT/DnrJ/EryC1/StrS family aminotransferase [SAR202 cluster bacterium]MQG58410.1 DegT/DnrJ/EryC1/StrS family aminotransferase [SAR202 cluster bacterium]|tara:strand:- start:7145 stop:8266 length:1122 start_codon:yes stop_codon:yes gene_type:complete